MSGLFDLAALSRNIMDSVKFFFLRAILPRKRYPSAAKGELGKASMPFQNHIPLLLFLILVMYPIVFYTPQVQYRVLNNAL